MSFLEALQRGIPFLAKRSPPSRAVSLSLRPVRNPAVTWKTKTETGALPGSEAADAPVRLVLSVPRRDEPLTRFLARVLGAENVKLIELDEFGSEVWVQCDGQNRVEDLVAQTARKYRLNVRQAEVSVVAFMRMLTQRRLIGFINEDRSSSHASQIGKSQSRRRRSKPRR